MFGKKLKIAIFCFSLSAVASASDDRAYVIDAKSAEDPASITSLKEAKKRQTGKIIFRDPTLEIKKDVKKVPVKTTIVKQFEKHPAKLKFKNFAIVGRNYKPRAEFERETLDIKIVDEPQRDDFLEKAYRPVERDFLFE